MLFTTAGTYHYVVKEKADPNKPYYQYDTTNYEVTVTVTAGNKNSLTASASVKKVGVDGTTDAVDFTNTYTAEGTSVQFSGTKTISGIESTDKVFSFSLYETGEDYVVAEGAEALRTASTS